MKAPVVSIFVSYALFGSGSASGEETWPAQQPTAQRIPATTAFAADELLHPAELLPPGAANAETVISLSELEALALSGNPTIAAATANIHAAHGQWVQVRLPPIPTASYVAAGIGDDIRADQPGGYFGQSS